ncbi:MAG: thiamine-phosphate kinase [Verrucomicrobiota bacterium]
MPKKSEDELVRSLTSLWLVGEDLVRGPGDDCAIHKPIPRGTLPVSKVDAIVEGVHFRSEDSAVCVGHKALARVFSDFAAMGATPRQALISIGYPFQERPHRWLKECYRGMARLAVPVGVGLAGGEITRSDQIWLSVSAMGWVPKQRYVLRNTARPGDVLFVTGRLGGSFPKRHLTFTPRMDEGRWLAEFGISAMMDLSDGLGKDLPRMAEASLCSFRIYPESVPKRRGCDLNQAVNDGEDYELLFAVSAKKAKRLEVDWPFSVPLTAIGEFLEKDEPVDTGGISFSGWDHVKAV